MKRLSVSAAGLAACLLTACGMGGEAEATSEAASTEAEAIASIPESLSPFGDGYPAAGDPCLRLGESAATSKYLDDSAILVGCPTEKSAAAVGGKIVDNINGVRIVSIAMGDANAAMEMDGPPPPPDEVYESQDALVAGTDYNATAQVACGVGGAKPTQSCDAGVKRGWGEDGTTLVEVTKPDGRKRAIFFRGTEAYGADSAQSDGSAGWDLNSKREGDRQTIRFGPETYVIVDAFVEGG